MTEQERLFRRAMKLEFGETLEINFESIKDMNSYRVLLYNVRNRLQEFGVLITTSANKKTIVLRKGIKKNITVKSKQGKKKIRFSSIEEERNKLFLKEKEEILAQAADNNWDISLTEELISAAFNRINSEITEGVEIEI